MPPLGLRPRLQPVAALVPLRGPAPLGPDPPAAPAALPVPGPARALGLPRPRPLPARPARPARRAPARDGPSKDVQDRVPGRRHPALPRPGHRHQHQTRRVRADQRGPRAARPGARVQPPAHRRRPVHLLLVPGRRLRGPGHRHPPRRRVRVRGLPEGRRGRLVLVRQGLATTCAATSTPPPWPATTCAPSPPGYPAPTRTSPNGSWPPLAPASGRSPWPSSAARPTRPRPPSGWSCPDPWPSWPTPTWPPASCPPRVPASTSPPSCADAGTVYMIAEAVSEEAPVAPLFAAMAAEIHWIAAQTGQASAFVAAGSAAADGPGRGDPDLPGPAAVLAIRLRRQGHPGDRDRARRGPARRAVGRPRPPGSPGHQLGEGVLPGITDVTTLQAASTLCGQASWKIRGQDHATRHDVATPDMIRQLPAERPGHPRRLRPGHRAAAARVAQPRLPPRPPPVPAPAEPARPVSRSSPIPARRADPRDGNVLPWNLT